LCLVLTLPPSSRIVFSFCRPTAALDGAERAAMEQVEAFTDKRGEPLITRFEVREMMAWLEELGFTRSWIVDKETPPPPAAEPERCLPHTTFGKIVCAVSFAPPFDDEYLATIVNTVEKIGEGSCSLRRRDGACRASEGGRADFLPSGGAPFRGRGLF
jgi:hypothetical protein